MKRLNVIAVCLLLVTAMSVTGLAQGQAPEKSGGDSKKEVKPKANAKDGAASSSGVAENDDEPVAKAIARVQEIDDRLAQFAKPIEETAELVRQMHNLKTDAKTREAIRLRLREFKAIADDFPKIKRDIKVVSPTLKESLGKAPSEFLRVAAEYDRKSTAEKYPAHQEKYREMATEARRHAEEYRKDFEAFDAKVELVLELIAFAEANGRLAQDMEKHLNLHRDAAKGQYLDRLIVVVGVQQKQFDALYRVWREYLDRRRGAIQDGPPGAPGLPPVPDVPSGLPSKGSSSDVKANKYLAAKRDMRDGNSTASSSVRVKLPADARLWVNGEEYVSASPLRSFETPKLPVTDSQYFYVMKMELQRGGLITTSTQRVLITPGQPVEVDFNAADSWMASR
jgi:uncharacterized protein (TIGR03000 family)